MPVTRSGGQRVGDRRRLDESQTQRGDGTPEKGGKAAATKAAQQSRQVTSTARGQGQVVAGAAKEQVAEVATTVKEQAGQLTQELSDQGRALYGEARDQLERQAEAQAGRLAEALHRLGTETQALADGRPGQAGTVGQYAQQWADRFHDVATGIENRGVDGLLEEAQDLARRSPGAFLLGAALVGFVGGRLVRSASSSEPSPAEDSLHASSAT